MIALAPIPAGSELLVTYVNPELGVRARRAQLLEWGFGDCRCTKCVEEAKKAKAKGDEENGIEGSAPPYDDLERELKAGLGVM